jgi:mannobiose 2-epimerase
LEARLARLRGEATAFWWPRAADRKRGGIHGHVDRRGVPCAPTHKSIVQQARHLWALATYCERRGRTPELQALGQSVRDLIRRNFLDPKDGEYRYLVSRDGDAIDATKVLYGEAFAVFGLATWGRVFAVDESVDAALLCFQSFDARAHDAMHGGYDERSEPEWLARGAPKETNTHIHVMEALTALLDATGDPRVRHRLHELVEVVSERLFQPSGYVHQFFEADFTPRGPAITSYGHDIETAWLLLDATRALGLPVSAVAGPAVKMAACALRDGFDWVHGGFFDSGVPGGPVTNREKVWWAQFEGIAGLWWLHRLTGDDRALDALSKTVDWLEGPQRDAEHGEWYWGVMPDRSLSQGDVKGTVWKATYHTLRALLFTEDWIADAAKQPLVCNAAGANS